MITWSTFGLQDSACYLIEELLFFHDFSIVVIVFIARGVGGAIFCGCLGIFTDKIFIKRHFMEFIWTAIPIFVLIQIALPSLFLLYVIDDVANCSLSIKTVGHQWYWSYEYRDYWSSKEEHSVGFDSFMLPYGELEDRGFRMLDVDNRAVLPYCTNIRVLVGSADVLHSWALPSLGVKADASPGRLNQLKVIRQRPGVFFGQCSEICGANHSFIPIVVEFVSAADYLM